MPGYPIVLDVRDRLAVVVGLGRVGRRRASGLVEAGARVLALDPATGLDVPPGVEHRAEAFRPGHLEGASLAFAAATTGVNRAVVAEARRLGIWVNAASEPDSGDFALPAAWREGRVELTVSTSGASPALARALRDRAARAIAGASGLVDLLEVIRPIALSRAADPEARRRLLLDLGDPRWLDVLASVGREAVLRDWLGRVDALHRGDVDTSPPGNAGD